MKEHTWTSEKLFEKLSKSKSQKAYWKYVNELRIRPSKYVYNKAYELAQSKEPRNRMIGIDVLSQLGDNPRFKIKKTLKLYFELLKKEEDTLVIMSILYGIGHNNEELKAAHIKQLAKFKTSKHPELREGLVNSLLGLEDNTAVNTLIFLMSDRESSIRDWATFGIGSLIQIDNPKINKALWARVLDKHEETRSEAILGLAIRGDKNIKEVIIQEMEEEDCGSLLFEAASELGDKSIQQPLEKLYKRYIKDKNISKGWLKSLKKCIKSLD